MTKFPQRILGTDNPALSQFYAWKVYIIHKEEDESLEEVQKKLISKFTHYATTHQGYGEENFRFLPEFTAGSIENENLQYPWNHYIQNKSVLRFVKRKHANNTREEIMNCPSALERYFGSAEAGRDQLHMSEWEWLKL